MKKNIAELISSKCRFFENYFETSLNFADKKIYQVYLTQTYYYVKQSCRLLKKAGEATQNEVLKTAFLSHVDEEMGHEHLAAKDYMTLTGGIVSDYPELDGTKNFWQSIDASIDADPLSMLGYALALEFLAINCAKALIDRASKFGDGCIQFLLEHYELDQDHTEKMMLLLDSLNQEELQSVHHFTDLSFSNFHTMCEGIRRYATSEKAKVA